MTTYWDGRPMPEPATTEEIAATQPRKWYCPHCKREQPINLNLVPINIDGKVNYRIAGFSVPSPCPWCGESAIREVAVEEMPPAPPQQPGTPIQRPSGLIVPR